MTSVMHPHDYQQVLPEYKIVVLGGGGVGKSSLTVRLCSDNFIDEYDPTVEDCYRKKCQIDGKNVMLEITDTAGQEEFQGMRDEWIREGDGYLLVYAINKSHTFEELFEIRQRILQTLDKEEAPIVLAGNKCDLTEERMVQKSELDKLAKEWHVPAFETSAKTKMNNVECFHQCVREILKYENSDHDNAGTHKQTTNKTKHSPSNIGCECCVVL